MAALAQRNAFQFRVRFFEIGNGRHQPCIQTAYCNGIFQSGSHRVTGKTFGVADNDMANIRPERRFQSVSFRTGRPATSWRIGFMRNKYQLFGNIAAVETKVFLRTGYQTIHHLGHMSYIQPGNMETAVCNLRR